MQIQVIGYTWSGTRCAYSYDQKQAPADLAAVKRLAGDFESIEDYRVIEITRGGDWSHEWTKREIVKEWNEEHSQDEYLELRGEG